MMNDKEYYTIDDVMKLLGLSRPTIKRGMLRGEIKYFKVGKMYRIPKSQFDNITK